MLTRNAAPTRSFLTVIPDISNRESSAFAFNLVCAGC